MDALCCKKCGAPFSADDLHLDLAIARCSRCRAVMDLAQARSAEPAQPAAPHSAYASTERPAVPLPPHFQLDRGSGFLEIRWNWRSAKTFALLFFCLFWDGFLVVWYAAALSAPRGAGVGMMLLFPLIHVAVGVGITYTAVAGLFNRTVLRVERSLLTIRHEPLPWFGNRELPVKAVEQLYCEERISRTSKGGTSISYRLWAILRPERRSLQLLSNLETPQQALFVEQQVEKHLRIVDAPVPGEMARERVG